MAAPTYSVGQVLAALDCNEWFTPRCVVKPGDTTRASNTTLTADPDLVAAATANAVYQFDCWLRYMGATTPGDLKIQWAIPSGALLRYNVLHNEGGTTGLSNSVIVYAAGDVPFLECGSSTSQEVAAFLTGTLAISSTAGNVSLLWAQNTSSGTATNLRQYSRLVLRRIQ